VRFKLRLSKTDSLIHPPFSLDVPEQLEIITFSILNDCVDAVFVEKNKEGLFATPSIPFIVESLIEIDPDDDVV
jgi:hypothetical protein